ncbi:hypothetical protein LIER_38538 [Lithospermum erythrorhizon]|uniref:Uncharacterized protein n=1 Tax=Lithospermum erythrorhizon TaxID=34254 RepID=A0AAV3Q2X9_LITER
MNLALLAKQGWRVVTRQASILYKLLKGRYFRNTSFLNAKVGYNPSFGWRSMLEGRKVVRKGKRWRVGDGKGIDIWKDPWVPRQTDFYMRGARNDGPRYVSQCTKNGKWDTELVKSVMDSDNANLVLAIPLSRQQIRDRLVWNHTKSGNYLTSSGYLSTRNMKRNGELGGSC